MLAHYNSGQAGALETLRQVPEDRRLVLQADLGTPGAALRLWQDAVAWRGHIDATVCNAGVLTQVAMDAALLKTVVLAYAREGVLAYQIAPGAVDTTMTEIAARNSGGPEAVRAGLAMGGLVPPREIAELVGVLCSGSLRHLSGATLDMNGASYVR